MLQRLSFYTQKWDLLYTTIGNTQMSVSNNEMKQVTIDIPAALYERILKQIPDGCAISDYIAAAISDDLERKETGMMPTEQTLLRLLSNPEVVQQLRQRVKETMEKTE